MGGLWPVASCARARDASPWPHATQHVIVSTEMMEERGSGMKRDESEQDPHHPGVDIAGSKRPRGLSGGKFWQRHDAEKAHRHAMRRCGRPTKEWPHQQNRVEKSLYRGRDVPLPGGCIARRDTHGVSPSMREADCHANKDRQPEIEVQVDRRIEWRVDADIR